MKTIPSRTVRAPWLIMALVASIPVIGACSADGSLPSRGGSDDPSETPSATPGSGTTPGGTTGGTGTPPPTGTVDPNRDGGGVPAPTESASLASTKFPGSKVFLPAVTPAPAVVMLHGSEGGKDGTINEFAEPLSKQGFVVVTLCWFDCGAGIPSTIRDVSLDRTVEAVTWLKNTKEVAGKKTGLYGWSRGGEQAALVASLVKQTDVLAAVAIHAPSDTVVANYDPATQDSVMITDPATGQQRFAAAWTWKGAPLFGEPGPNFTPAGPRIVIEGYAGPLFVSHGTSDEIWEVARSQRIVASRSGVTAPTEPHYWQRQPHGIIQFTAAMRSQYDQAFFAFMKKYLASP